MDDEKKNPIISVLMGIYNEKNKNYVIQAIDSILQQSLQILSLLSVMMDRQMNFMHGCRMCVGRILAFGYCVMIKIWDYLIH